MKTVKKNVYYCDHCKKRGLSGFHISTHEKKCTANPDRQCGFCNLVTGVSTNIREIVDEYKKRFIIELTPEMTEDIFSIQEEIVVWTGYPLTLKEIRDRVDNCPSCIFSIIRQCKLNHHYFEPYDFKDFDYKKEMAECFAENKPEQYHYEY